MNFASLMAELNTPVTRESTLEYRQRKLSEEGFNSAQISAVLAPITTSVQVQAGAGTGKTRVLVSRVVHLLENGVSPSDMLICTFTRNAAEEMRARLPKYRDQLKGLGTIHSLALRHTPRTTNAYTPVQLIPEEEVLLVLEGLTAHFPNKNEDAKDVLLKLSRMRENRKVVPEYEALLAAYFAELASQGVQDFLMLIEAGILRATTRRYRYILVDEAQDVTALQVDWLRKVAAPDARVYWVGDENQAIYGFRGSSRSLLSGDGITRISLNLNYRCAPEVLDMAQRMLSENAPKLVATQPAGNPVEILQFAYDALELDAIQGAYALAPDKTEFMVLARTNALLQPLIELGIPCMTVHGSKGKEWDQVWVMGMEAGNFPEARGDLDEEHRLAYVAMTRARRQLVLSWAARREVGVNRNTLEPSLFLSKKDGLPTGTLDW